ncbi:MAG: multicopper oxidase [Polyangiales bacterium]
MQTIGIARLFVVATALAGLSCKGATGGGQPLEIGSQRPFTNPLPIPETAVPGTHPAYPGADYYEMHVTRFQQWFGMYAPNTTRRLATTVWGYGQVDHDYDTGVVDAQGATVRQSGSYIAPTIVAQRGRPVVVRWIDDRRDAQGRPETKHLLEPAYDTTLMGTMDGEPHVRMVTHLHGGETAPDSDGDPMAWYTPDPNAAENGMGGPPGNAAVYTYPNQQPPTTLWYHDHSMGIVRLNVMAMGAGLYVIRDPAQEAALNLPSGAYEIPLVIADRKFERDGSLRYLDDSNMPMAHYHPKMPMEFFGNVMTVNGMAWPYLEVEPRKYRFRMLNASNSRMVNLRLVDEATGALHPEVFQIGSDGGYLGAPVRLDMERIVVATDSVSTANQLFMAPAERADIVIDFSTLAPGTTLYFENDAPTPFPDGDPPDPATVRVMQFRVVPSKGPDTSTLPATLSSIPTRLDASAATVTRHMVLTEVADPATGDIVVGLLNNTCYDAPITETPRLGSTEIWEIVNATDDTHPIHLHLVQFNVLDRQRISRDDYLAGWNAAAGTVGRGTPGPAPTCGAHVAHLPPPGGTDQPQNIPSVGPVLIGGRILPAANEAGWKDTVRVKDETVTRLLVRFAPQDPAASGAYGGYSFDPTTAPYVWHCHILEHEDNMMMRPYRIVPP